ncbi:DUF4913 domain-containing protein [Kitasatospora sp. NPDC093558]|uniref:DUF4913 domain-containing protein n=1 Tax=Kitasatospora sp. NPDC093558 TaxID=3155201 RepID=UPI00343C6A21
MTDAVGPHSDLPSPAAMAEDIEDLKAELRALRAELPSHGQPTAEDPTPNEERQYPPFIFLLEGEELDAELRLLAEWVEGVLVPGILAEPSADARWCHLWTEHWDAVGLLHATWLAWQELTDPTTCGLTGPSIWYRDHYRPHITDLRSPTGPFAGCTKGEHRTDHRLPGRVPSTWHTVEDSG